MERLFSQIITLVKRQKNEFNQIITGNIHPRDGVAELEDAMSSPLVKVILGPRRCGKSTLAKTALAHQKCAYLNFEDEAFPDVGEVTGDAIMEALTQVYPSAQIFFFDEIQNFPRWEQFVHRLHREGRNVVLTGSNAHLLSQELASALTVDTLRSNFCHFRTKSFL
jgi:predicted AAA+ superfamily ATPase